MKCHGNLNGFVASFGLETLEGGEALRGREGRGEGVERCGRRAACVSGRAAPRRCRFLSRCRSAPPAHGRGIQRLPPIGRVRRGPARWSWAPRLWRSVLGRRAITRPCSARGARRGRRSSGRVGPPRTSVPRACAPDVRLVHAPTAPNGTRPTRACLCPPGPGGPHPALEERGVARDAALLQECGHRTVAPG